MLFHNSCPVWVSQGEKKDKPVAETSTNYSACGHTRAKGPVAFNTNSQPNQMSSRPTDETSLTATSIHQKCISQRCKCSSPVIIRWESKAFADPQIAIMDWIAWSDLQVHSVFDSIGPTATRTPLSGQGITEMTFLPTNRRSARRGASEDRSG